MKLFIAVTGLLFLVSCQPYPVPPPSPPPPVHMTAPMPAPPPPPPIYYPADSEPPRYVQRHYRRYERRGSRRCPVGYTWVRAHQRTVSAVRGGEVHRSTKTIPGRCVRT